MAAFGSLNLVLFAESNPSIVPVMVMLAKGGVKTSFIICYFVNSQIFPAIFAGTAFGICNIGARLASILSPLFAEV